MNANLAFSHARYKGSDPAGDYIEDAPTFIGSAGVLVDKLGSHPLVEDNSVRSNGYREINANIGFKLRPGFSARVDVYNVTNAQDDAADYYYTTRLAGEPAAGVDGIQIHPLETRSFRLTLSAGL